MSKYELVNSTENNFYGENCDEKLYLRVIVGKLNFDLTSPHISRTVSFGSDLELSWRTIKHEDFDRGYEEFVVRTKDGRTFRRKESCRVTLKKVRHHTLSCIGKGQLRRLQGLAFSEEEKAKAYGESKSIGMVAHPRSNVVIFDIDCHDGNIATANQAAMFLLREFAHTTPIYAEKGDNAGYHIGYKLGNLSDKAIESYLKSFKAKYGLTIEARTTKKALRLPSSYSYATGKIGLENNQITFMPHKTVDEFSQSVLNHDSRVRLLPKSNEKDYIPDFLVLDEEKEQIVERQSASGSSKNVHTDFPIYAGSRTETMRDLAFCCIRQDLSEEEYYQAVLVNNIDSKDLCKWSQEKVRVECSKYFAWAQKKFKAEYATNCSTGFISNIPQLSNDLKTKLEKLAKLLAQKNPKKYAKNQKNYAKAMRVLLLEIFGKIIYDRQNPRKVNELVKLRREKKEQILKGIDISHKYLGLLKSHYNLKSHIHAVFKDLLTYSNVLEQYKHNNLGYCFNPKYPFCRQFTLTSSKPLLLLVKDEYKRLSPSYKYLLGKSITHNTQSIVDNIDLYPGIIDIYIYYIKSFYLDLEGKSKPPP